MENNNSKINTILLIVVIVLLAIGIALQMMNWKQATPDTVMVTPNTHTQTLQNATGSDYTPSQTSTGTQSPQYSFTPLTTQYTAYQTFPVVTTVASSYNCTAFNDADGLHYLATHRTIGGKNFCVQTTTDAAMSHRYTHYIYTNGTTQIQFTTSQVSCGVYDDPQKMACEAEQNSFSADQLVLSAM